MSCPQCPHCRATAEEALCESPVEIMFLREIRKHPEFDVLTPNVEVMAGRYRIDFANANAMIGVEIDGHQFHSDKQTFVKDRHRQRVLEQTGWRITRFAAIEVMDDAANCVHQFRHWMKAVWPTLAPERTSALNPTHLPARDIILDRLRAAAPIAQEPATWFEEHAQKMIQEDPNAHAKLGDLINPTNLPARAAAPIDPVTGRTKLGGRAHRRVPT